MGQLVLTPWMKISVVQVSLKGYLNLTITILPLCHIFQKWKQVSLKCPYNLND